MNDFKTVVITGAGISVESGIQPFRGANGIWNENPMEMATFHKFETNPALFLNWYYHRFISCRNALPNEAHFILANNAVPVITQNIDNLHHKAHHPQHHLIEIHGNINFKRKINATHLNELVAANWDAVNEQNLQDDLLSLFKIHPSKTLDFTASYRPHVLLFDEFYAELYQYQLALHWLHQASTIIFMGTSNSVGFTATALDIALTYHKKIIVVDPNPASSLQYSSIEIFKESATQFCKHYFSS